MPTRRHFISAINAALGSSVFTTDGKPKTLVLQSAWDTVNIGHIGLPEWLLEMDDTPVEKLAETLFAIDADYPAALAKVKKAMAYVNECFSGSMKHVKSVLAEP